MSSSTLTLKVLHLGGKREPVLKLSCGGAWPEEAMHVKFCGQDEEPGSIMRVKLATRSCHEQKSSNCAHQSKIKGFNNQWDLITYKNATNLAGMFIVKGWSLLYLKPVTDSLL